MPQSIGPDHVLGRPFPGLAADLRTESFPRTTNVRPVDLDAVQRFRCEPALDSHAPGGDEQGTVTAGGIQHRGRRAARKSPLAEGPGERFRREMDTGLRGALPHGRSRGRSPTRIQRNRHRARSSSGRIPLIGADESNGKPVLMAFDPWTDRSSGPEGQRVRSPI